MHTNSEYPYWWLNNSCRSTYWHIVRCVIAQGYPQKLPQCCCAKQPTDKKCSRCIHLTIYQRMGFFSPGPSVVVEIWTVLFSWFSQSDIYATFTVDIFCSVMVFSVCLVFVLFFSDCMNCLLSRRSIRVEFWKPMTCRFVCITLLCSNSASVLWVVASRSTCL